MRAFLETIRSPGWHRSPYVSLFSARPAAGAAPQGRVVIGDHRSSAGPRHVALSSLSTGTGSVSSSLGSALGDRSCRRRHQVTVSSATARAHAWAIFVRLRRGIRRAGLIESDGVPSRRGQCTLRHRGDESLFLSSRLHPRIAFCSVPLPTYALFSFKFFLILLL